MVAKRKDVVVSRGAGVVVEGAVCPRCGGPLVLSRPASDRPQLRCEVKACEGPRAAGILKAIGGAPCAS